MTMFILVPSLLPQHVQHHHIDHLYGHKVRDNLTYRH